LDRRYGLGRPDLEVSTSAEGSPHLSRGDPYTVTLSDKLAFRIYPDSRPYNLKVAQLQKGIVLVFKGKDLVEEGVGMGVPVAVYSDETYFASTAELSRDYEGGKGVTKRFFMDSVSRKSWKINRIVNSRIYRMVSRLSAGIYRDYPFSRRVIFPLMMLRNKLRIRTTYAKASSRGEIAVTYSVEQGNLGIRANFLRLNRRSLRKIVLLNEQGASFFRRFRDSEGLDLVGDKIGAWDHVKGEWASLSDIGGGLSFRVKQLSGSRLFVGREFVKGHLAWTGMGYEVEPHLDTLSYTVQIQEHDR
jgi:hypothetical protein